MIMGCMLFVVRTRELVSLLTAFRSGIEHVVVLREQMRQRQFSPVT